MHYSFWRRRGTTLAELLIALVIVGALTGVAIPRFARLRDRLAVRAAGADIISAFAVARHAAIMRASRVAVIVDSPTVVLMVRRGIDTLTWRPLGSLHGVSLSASRDSVAYAPNGMGYGAANTRLIVRRGAAAETVTTSRLGRVRR